MNKPHANFIRGMTISFAVLAMAAGFCCYHVLNAAPTQSAANSGLYKVEPQAVLHVVDIGGVFTSAQTSVIAAPFDAVIMRRNFAWGTFLPKGFLLFSLSTTAQDAEINSAQIDVLKAQTQDDLLHHWAEGPEMTKAASEMRAAVRNLHQLDGQIADEKKLLDAGLVARDDYNQLLGQRVSLELAVEEARNGLEIANDDGNAQATQEADLTLGLATTKLAALGSARAGRNITMPFDGIIMKQPSTGGGSGPEPNAGIGIKQGDVLAIVQSTGEIMMLASVDETDIGKIKPGQSVKINAPDCPDSNVGAPNQNSSQISGVVSSIGLHPDDSNAVTPQAAMFDVRITIDQQGNALTPCLRLGMTAHGSIMTYNNPNALMVPINALWQSNGQTMLDLRDDHNEFHAVSVKTGVVDVDKIEILSGVAAGSVVRETGMAGGGGS